MPKNIQQVRPKPTITVQLTAGGPWVTISIPDHDLMLQNTEVGPIASGNCLNFSSPVAPPVSKAMGAIPGITIQTPGFKFSDAVAVKNDDGTDSKKNEVMNIYYQKLADYYVDAMADGVGLIGLQEVPLYETPEWIAFNAALKTSAQGKGLNNISLESTQQTGSHHFGTALLINTDMFLPIKSEPATDLPGRDKSKNIVGSRGQIHHVIDRSTKKNLSILNFHGDYAYPEETMKAVENALNNNQIVMGDANLTTDKRVVIDNKKIGQHTSDFMTKHKDNVAFLQTEVTVTSAPATSSTTQPPVKIATYDVLADAFSQQNNLTMPQTIDNRFLQKSKIQSPFTSYSIRVDKRSAVEILNKFGSENEDINRNAKKFMQGIELTSPKNAALSKFTFSNRIIAARYEAWRIKPSTSNLVKEGKITKDKEIEKTTMLLADALVAGDNALITQHFNTLCLITCKKRYWGKGTFSTETTSAKNLIQNILKNENLKIALGVTNEQQIKTKMMGIIDNPSNVNSAAAQPSLPTQKPVTQSPTVHPVNSQQQVVGINPISPAVQNTPSAAPAADAPASAQFSPPYSTDGHAPAAASHTAAAAVGSAEQQPVAPIITNDERRDAPKPEDDQSNKVKPVIQEHQQPVQSVSPSLAAASAEHAANTAAVVPFTAAPEAQVSQVPIRRAYNEPRTAQQPQPGQAISPAASAQAAVVPVAAAAQGPQPTQPTALSHSQNDQKEKNKIAHLEQALKTNPAAYAKYQARPSLTNATQKLLSNFLQKKKEAGETLYQNMTEDQFLDRLLQDRPDVFYMPNDVWQTRDGKKGYGWPPMENGYQLKVPGTERPYLSYAEMELASLIGVGSNVEFINDGNRDNKGAEETYKYQLAKTTSNYGAIGVRFENSKCHSRQFMCPGEYEKAGEDKASLAEVKLWEGFYKERGYTGDFPPSKRDDDLVGFPGIQVNRQLYRIKMKENIAAYLADANDRGNKGDDTNLGVYCHVVGLGAGAWAGRINGIGGLDPAELADIQLGIYQELIESGNYPNIRALDMSYFTPKIPAQPIITKNGQRVEVMYTNSAPGAALPYPYTVMHKAAQYAWDPGSKPGNEYFLGSEHFAESGDPAAACACADLQAQNPAINPFMNATVKLVSASVAVQAPQSPAQAQSTAPDLHQVKQSSASSKPVTKGERVGQQQPQLLERLISDVTTMLSSLEKATQSRTAANKNQAMQVANVQVEVDSEKNRSLTLQNYVEILKNLLDIQASGRQDLTLKNVNDHITGLKYKLYGLNNNLIESTNLKNPHPPDVKNNNESQVYVGRTYLSDYQRFENEKTLKLDSINTEINETNQLLASAESIYQGIRAYNADPDALIPSKKTLSHAAAASNSAAPAIALQPVPNTLSGAAAPAYAPTAQQPQPDTFVQTNDFGMDSDIDRANSEALEAVETAALEVTAAKNPDARAEALTKYASALDRHADALADFVDCDYGQEIDSNRTLATEVRIAAAQTALASTPRVAHSQDQFKSACADLRLENPYIVFLKKLLKDNSSSRLQIGERKKMNGVEGVEQGITFEEKPFVQMGGIRFQKEEGDDNFTAWQIEPGTTENPKPSVSKLSLL